MSRLSVVEKNVCCPLFSIYVNDINLALALTSFEFRRVLEEFRNEAFGKKVINLMYK